MARYMTITRTSGKPGGSGKYGGSWHASKSKAKAFGHRIMKRDPKVKRFVVTKKPKRRYKF